MRLNSALDCEGTPILFVTPRWSKIFPSLDVTSCFNSSRRAEASASVDAFNLRTKVIDLSSDPDFRRSKISKNAYSFDLKASDFLFRAAWYVSFADSVA